MGKREIFQHTASVRLRRYSCLLLRTLKSRKRFNWSTGEILLAWANFARLDLCLIYASVPCKRSTFRNLLTVLSSYSTVNLTPEGSRVWFPLTLFLLFIIFPRCFLVLRSESSWQSIQLYPPPACFLSRPSPCQTPTKFDKVPESSN